ncbi:hypothetical protein NLG97_g305 [Lecanicillium saksenae]|uniref:Uncharacterized protein n=1 Tax=Lecanicillium saksenae TaxID=468837 RepID=A0ACC1R8D4_9HYPO|nr:hypothetical protein NLG97_g305 [Lecanicillium saksenae]
MCPPIVRCGEFHGTKSAQSWGSTVCWHGHLKTQNANENVLELILYKEICERHTETGIPWVRSGLEKHPDHVQITPAGMMGQGCDTNLATEVSRGSRRIYFGYSLQKKLDYILLSGQVQRCQTRTVMQVRIRPSSQQKMDQIATAIAYRVM